MVTRRTYSVRAEMGGVGAALVAGCAALLTAMLPMHSPAQIVINELMYHPDDGWHTNASGAWLDVTNETEYIELYNAGSNAVDLSTYRFDNGVSYSFPTGTVLSGGAFLVVCQNRAAFSNAYTNVTWTTSNCVGDYNGGLNNGGERVTLSRFDGTQWVEVASIKYLDGGLSDGDGYSLELVHPGFSGIRSQYYGAWAVSTNTGTVVSGIRYAGTPGRTNSVYNAAAKPVIGDVGHDPALPPAGSVVLITCKAGVRVPGSVDRVNLLWRWDQIPQTNDFAVLEMYDDGLNGDEIAGDGTYSILFPPVWFPAATNAQLLDFRISAFDQSGGSITSPVASTAGVLAGPYSYFCYFGSDPGFNGEYPTYHILMTASNKLAKETMPSPKTDSVLVDTTFITSKGRIFYNSGFRFRGSDSTVGSLGGYRISLPRGETIDGCTDLNFIHDMALRQYFGQTIMLTAGNPAAKVELSRIWFNSDLKAPNQGIYVRMERYDPAKLERDGWSTPIGNFYGADGDGLNGNLATYSTDINWYRTQYYGETNYEPTMWISLSNLCSVLTNDPSRFPQVLTNRVDVREWARHFATQVCLDNREAGYGCPWDGSVRGDELRIYCDPSDGLFEIFPWDFSDVMNNNGAAGTGILAWNPFHRRFLFNRPMAPFYFGDCMSVATNTMSAANMNVLLDAMGSALGAYRTEFSNHAVTVRANVLANVYTNFTVFVTNAVNQSNNVAVVSSNSISLSGRAPFAYTDKVRANGQVAEYATQDVANMLNTYNCWYLTNRITLTQTVNTVLLETLDSYGNVLLSMPLTVIVRTNSVPEGGAIGGATVWDRSSIHYVLSDVTVGAGASLTVQAGATVMFDAGKKISVGAGGVLNVVGLASDPVYMFPSNGVSAWSIEGSGAGATVSVTNAQMNGGRFVVSGSAGLTLSDSILAGNANAGGIINASGSGLVTMRRCVVSDFAKTTFSGTFAQIEETLFKNMTDCAMEFSVATGTVSRTSITNSMAAAAEGVRFLSGGSGVLTNCLIGRIAGSAVRAASGSGNAVVCNTMIYSCGTGVVVQGATVISNFNNTITMCGVGLSGSAATTWNSIVWSNTVATNAGPAVSYSDVELPLYAVCAGAANIDRDPWFTDLAALDCRLQSISPCLGSGIGGANMGATFPAGSTPMWPSNLVVAPDTNLVVLTWSDNSSDEDRFEVQRSSDGITWMFLTNVAANTTTCTDRGLAPETVLWYRVRAAHRRGESLWSEERQTNTVALTSTADLRQYLRITEIMYNPPGGDPYEFIELKNTGGSFLNLAGLVIDRGITYHFPSTNLAAGAFFVIAASNTPFRTLYPGVTNQGVFESGKLSDGGEQLRIVDGSVNVITDFTYKDGWFKVTDGGGYSLVPADLSMDPGVDAAWRASTYTNGSPGADDPPWPYGSVVVNEVLAHQDVENPGDWIELYNAGTNNVGIGGWYLSDDDTNLKKYRIPSGAVLTAGTYVVFNEYSNFGTNAWASGTNNGFALSEWGDKVHLSSADASSNLTSFRTSVKFGASDNGVTFGRYVRSDGNADFPAMSTRTPGASNSYPLVGPVVISEIMYNPGPGGKEFVEICNVAGSNVSLWATDNPVNTWGLDGGIQYRFPTNTTMASNEYALVVGIDPAEFRQIFGLTNLSLKVFGPFSGALANNGDSVELYKPGGQELSGYVPTVRVDRVEYEDQSPWPALADNGGASLERRRLMEYGNDPTNWIAASLGGTPGSANNTNGIPIVAFTTTHGDGYETNGTVNVSVSLFPANTGIVTVAYGVVGGTASQGLDYALSPGSLVFWPYDTAKQISLSIMSDAVQEADETVLIALTNVTSNARLGGNTLFTWTIIDTNRAVLAAPTIWPSGTNTFSNSVSFTITSAVPNSTIFYSTDGSIPDSGNTAYTGAVVLTSSARITARAYLGSVQTSSWSTALFLEVAPPWQTDPNIISVRVSTTNDDAAQGSVGNMNLTGLYLPFGRNESTEPLWTGVRFTGINVGAGMVITNAYIQFTVYTATNADVSAKIFGQLTNNAASFTSANKSISARQRTTNSVLWSMSASSAWSPTNYAGREQRTPCITNLMNEILAMPGWTSGSAMVFIFSNNLGGMRSAYSYDGGGTNYAPVLRYWTATQAVQQYWLSVLTNGAAMGTITGGNRWVTSGSNVNVVASALPHYQFGSWTGDVSGISSTSSPSINVTMTGSRTLWGSFTDILYTNGVTEAWLAQYYPSTNNYTNAVVSDTDLDGYKAWQEFIAGTIPTNPLSMPYWLHVYTNGPGTITGGNTWYRPGVTATVDAAAASHYRFVSWTGTVEGIVTSSPNVSVPMTNDRSIWGNFADIFYTNGVTEIWLYNYYPFTNDFTNAANSDTDSDGHKAWQEFIAGTDPTNSLSVLRVQELIRTGGWHTVSWPAVGGKIYSVYRSTNMVLTWPAMPITNNLSSPTNGTVIYTDPETNIPSFYRIIVQ